MRRLIAGTAAIVLAMGMACGDDDDDNGTSGAISEGDFLEACIAQMDACDKEDEADEAFYESHCQTQWEHIHDQDHTDSSACAAAIADLQQCVADAGCPEDAGEICTSEAMANAEHCDAQM